MDARTYPEIPRQGNTAAEWRLYYGGDSKPVLLVVSDPTPGMWRIWANGWLSDYANLSRAKDAAEVIAERGPPARNRQRFHWKAVGDGRRRPVARPAQKNDPKPSDGGGS
jgi:hypothetical protein